MLPIPALSDQALKHFRQSALRVLGTKSPDPARIDRITAAIASRAENGDVAAFQALRDTLDGKPSQEITGANGGPIALEFRINYEATQDAKTIDHDPQMGLETSQEAQGTAPDG